MPVKAPGRSALKQNNVITSYFGRDHLSPQPVNGNGNEAPTSVSPHRIISQSCSKPAGKHEVNSPARLLTDYFPTRRSQRRNKQQQQAERQADTRRRLASHSDTDLQVRAFGEKGRGVVTTRRFCRGELVVEYAGQLLDCAEARQRESAYSSQPSTGCYMYYFSWAGRSWCVDATAESGRLGRLVNHSRALANLRTRVLEVASRPRLVLEARRDIEAGEELLYDYGDRSKQSLLHHPWLAS